ncbi:MAG: M48 family metallopeptidase [Gemmatimonadota bacterium]|jgi:predicted Zn-dependent protease|nr:M48 family metallopeptidase [Gemmatimonadota bacterium]
MRSWKIGIRRGLFPLFVAGSVATASGCAPALTTQQEVQAGAEYAAQINRQLPIVREGTINSYINGLGSRLARQADPRGIRYTFYVVNSDVVNAFAVPGGHIYVNRGLIERAANLSELAGVLGHEVAHVSERHSVERLQKAQNANLGLGVVYGILLGGRSPGAVEQGAVQGVGSLVFAGYSRDAEREADAVGVQVVTRAGINPQGMVTFFQKLLQEERRTPGALQWFATHPGTEERITRVQQAIQQTPGARGGSLATDDRSFQQFKNRVRQLPAAPRQNTR